MQYSIANCISHIPVCQNQKKVRDRLAFVLIAHICTGSEGSRKQGHAAKGCRADLRYTWLQQVPAWSLIFRQRLHIWQFWGYLKLCFQAHKEPSRRSWLLILVPQSAGWGSSEDLALLVDAELLWKLSPFSYKHRTVWCQVRFAR